MCSDYQGKQPPYSNNLLVIDKVNHIIVRCILVTFLWFKKEEEEEKELDKYNLREEG